MKTSSLPFGFAARKADPAKPGSDIVVLPVNKGGGLHPVSQWWDHAYNGLISQHLKREKFGKDEDKVLWIVPSQANLPKLLMVIVEPKEEDQAFLVKAYAQAGKMCLGKEGIAIGLADLTDQGTHSAVEGFLLGLYAFNSHKGADKATKQPQKVFVLCKDSVRKNVLEKSLQSVVATVDAVYLARHLVNEPANIMNPTAFEKICSSVARQEKLTMKVFHQAELKRRHMNLINAVGMGSIEMPRLIHLKYESKTKSRCRVAIVGKGVTFDSGGLSLKPQAGMYGMKNDMAGAAAALAIAKGLTANRVAVDVDIFMPVVENMPSDRSIKPGDVIKGYSGKTVEIENTDAEGRLILADALAYALEYKPKYIIDMATLTGACVVALGEEIGGAMSNNQDLVNRLIDTGRTVGESLWQLPLHGDYVKMLKSDVADLKNVGGRDAGAITAGLFLQEFVNKVPWVHLDVAGPACPEKDTSLSPRGGSGFPVRTVLRFLANLT